MRIPKLHHSFTALAAVALFLPATAPAQGLVPVPTPPRHVLGVSGVLARPVGDFQTYVDWGGGLSIYWLANFDRGRHLGLRVDGTALIYGHESFDVPFSPTVGRVILNVATDNYIAGLGAGPQLTLFSGPIRPYVYGTAGFSYFATVSSLRGTSNGSSFAETTNFDDVAFALAAGAGVTLRVSSGRHPIALDFAAQSTHNGEAEYLRRGGIIDNGDGTVTLLPIRSDANLLTFRAGIAIGL